MIPSPEELIKEAIKFQKMPGGFTSRQGGKAERAFDDVVSGRSKQVGRRKPVGSGAGIHPAAAGLGAAALAGGAYALYKRRKANEAKAKAEGQKKAK